MSAVEGAELREWLDRSAIADLIHRYSDAVTRADWEQCEAVYAPDAMWESPLLGLFEVNALHNIVHILLGAILLYGSMSYAAAIQTTRGVGIVLLILGVLGFVAPDGFGLVPLGGNDIWLHLATGAILLATGFMATDEASATV